MFELSLPLGERATCLLLADALPAASRRFHRLLASTTAGTSSGLHGRCGRAALCPLLLEPLCIIGRVLRAPLVCAAVGEDAFPEQRADDDAPVRTRGPRRPTVREEALACERGADLRDAHARPAEAADAFDDCRVLTRLGRGGRATARAAATSCEEGARRGGVGEGEGREGIRHVMWDKVEAGRWG